MNSILLLAMLLLDEAPAKFHIAPYLQWPEPNAMTIKWESSEAERGEVQFGPTQEMTERVAEAEPVTLHELRLTELRPSTRYYYRVRSGGGWSEPRSFRTAPEYGTERWRMVVYGDSRSFPDRHRRVVEIAARFEPDVILHTGDQVARGSQRPLWKKEFFDPAADLFSRVPVVTALGNHEEGSRNYYDYLALPGNEQYFNFRFGNAQFIILDSNEFGSKPRNTEQFKWLERELSESAGQTKWTFTAFHHSLFSGHDKRSISRLRWELSPLFEQHGVDMVLTGHDHFYFRSRPIGRLVEGNRGMIHVTTAGGGAPLYSMKERSYSVVSRSVHHCMVLDFDGDRVHAKAVDVDGEVIDEFALTKRVPPASEFCSYEMYELSHSIRQVLERAPAVKVAADARDVTVDQTLEVSHSFQTPVVGQVSWISGDTAPVRVRFEPGKAVTIPIRARVSLLASLPQMRLEMLDERFRNRQIDFSPLKIARELVVRTHSDKKLSAAELANHQAHGYPFVRANGQGAASLPTRLHLARSAERVWISVIVDDAELAVSAGPAESASSDALSKGRHLRVLLATPDGRHTLIVSPQGRRAARGRLQDDDWQATNYRVGDHWVVQFELPAKVLDDAPVARINAVHVDPVSAVEDCLSPNFDVGSDPDLIPDLRFGDDLVDRFPLWELN